MRALVSMHPTLGDSATEDLKSYLSPSEWRAAIKEITRDGGRFVDDFFYWSEPSRKWVHRILRAEGQPARTLGSIA